MSTTPLGQPADLLRYGGIQVEVRHFFDLFLMHLWLQEHLLFIYSSSSSSTLLETRIASGYRDWLGPILAVVLTWPRIQWQSVAFFKGIKQSGRENDHSPPSTAKAKNYWSYISTDPIRHHCVHEALPVLTPSLLRAQSYFLTKLLQSSAWVCAPGTPLPSAPIAM